MRTATRPAARVLVILVPLLATSPLACDGDGGPSTVAQACDLVAGDLLITEVMANPTAGENGVQWFEVYNASGRALSLAGVLLEAGSPDNPRSHLVPAVLDPGLQPGAFLVVGDGNLEDGITGYSWSKLVLANDGATIRIRCGEVVVDEVAYGADAAGPGKSTQGFSWQLSSRAFPAAGAAGDPTVNDAPDAWCLAQKSDEPFDADGDRGTPGAANRACDVAGECLDGDAKRAAVPPAPGDLVITEVFANSRSGAGEARDDKDKEWIEVHALKDVDLVGLLVENRNGVDAGDSSRSFPIESASCLRIASGTWGVLAGSADPARNGHLPAVFHAFPDGFLLYNGGTRGKATLSLVDGNGTVLASAVYPECTADDVSANLMPEFCSNAAAAEDDLNWCPASAEGNFDGTGTPGGPNTVCPQ